MTWETHSALKKKTQSPFRNFSYGTFTCYLSPVELLLEQERALKRHILLVHPPRRLIGPPWAESPVTHTAAAAMVGNYRLLSVCWKHWENVCISSSGIVSPASVRARTLRLFVSSSEQSPAARRSWRCCCFLAVGGGAAPQGEEPDSSPEPHKVSALIHEHLHLKTRSNYIKISLFQLISFNDYV